jgi:hypothetical protein
MLAEWNVGRPAQGRSSAFHPTPDLRAREGGTRMASFFIDRIRRNDRSGQSQRRRWESNPLEPGCSRSPGRLAPASTKECPRQELNLVHDLRRVVCESVTLRGRDQAESPARESNSALRLRRPPCARHTREEQLEEYPCQESNLVHDLRTIACESGTLQGRKQKLSRGARIRTLCASFGGSLLSQEHAPVVIGTRERCRRWLMPGRAPAHGPETCPSFRCGHRARHRPASTRGEPAGGAVAFPLAREYGRPFWRCTSRRRPHS